MTMDTTNLEMDILAAVMENPQAFDDVAGIIERDDFCNPTNRALWDAISTLAKHRRTFDAVSLSAHLDEIGRQNLAPNISIILKNASSTSARGVAVAKAQRIRQVSVIRQLAIAGNAISELAHEHSGRDINDLLSEAEGILSSVIMGNGTDEIPVVDGVTIMRDVCDEFERAMNNPGISGISTGLDILDNKTDGLQSGSMVIVAGPPSMGKTAFAVNLMQNALSAVKLPVVMFSMEMPAIDIARRMVSTQSRVSYGVIKRGIALSEDVSRIYHAASTLQNPLLKICDASMLTPAKMRSVLKRISREHGGIAMAMVDYVQLMEANRKNTNRVTELSEISRELKRMAMDYKMPFVVLAQLTKDVEKQKRKPNNGDIRESGQLAQDADLIMFVHRQEKYDDGQNIENIGKAEIIIGKNRNGECGTVTVGYDGPTFRFYEIGGQSW